MRITVEDIENKEFKKAMRGYNSEEVDDFLNDVLESYEEVSRENSRLKEKITSFEEKIIHYKKVEDTIQNTLVLAQSASEQTKLAAQKEADLIIKNANDSAQRMIDKANTDVLTIRAEYEKTRQEFEKFRSIYRNFMNSQIDMFERLEKDFDRGFNIGIAQQKIIANKDIDSVIDEESKKAAIQDKMLTLEVATDLDKNISESLETTRFFDVKNFDLE
ncbi:cell division initiation protein [Clostridium collagenovorans DSM 3089]|uniref:Cell division initiation protein n=1 Tax=Clostridium collagenovorans DSM 3089 TaxID=1121306 RepID=A0A1M5T153_9CLOT|nr:DivIVA domain-containing protein [Clostridium collagenovorans]SHH44554.1 cell division initiation protein [Clostridium collagenovorans DSM 3089]